MLHTENARRDRYRYVRSFVLRAFCFDIYPALLIEGWGTSGEFVMSVYPC